jgi:hydrogenase/urease accessory protein HupE
MFISYFLTCKFVAMEFGIVQQDMGLAHVQLPPPETVFLKSATTLSTSMRRLQSNT